MRAWVAENPGAEGKDLSPLDQFAHQAPSLLVLISAPVRDSKIPVWEQQMSAGALGMNLLHAAHAHGYVGSWLTGWAAYSPAVAAAFGVGEGEPVTGHFFFGNPGHPLKQRPPPNLISVGRPWAIYLQ